MLDPRALDWSEILRRIRDLATSETARSRIERTTALASPQEAQKSFSEIVDASRIITRGVRPYAQSLDLFSTWFLRLKRNAVLKTAEIRDVRSFCLECLALNEALKMEPSEWTDRSRQRLMRAEEPLSAIDHVITPEGDIRSDASERLYNLTQEKSRLAREIHQTLDRLVKDHDMEGILQDKFVTTREGRWVIPVRSGMQHSIGGVIHGSSQTKQTVYMEPDKVIPLNNRLSQVEAEIEEEIERLLTQLSSFLHSKAWEFQSSRDVLEEADIRFAQAQFAGQTRAQPIEFSETEILLNDVRHPLLELTGKPVVANTVRLDEKKSILLLSGPNAGGKTVLLKSIGLAAQMARCGLLVCAAESSRIPFFSEILTGIGDAQSVDESLSTFAAHLKILDQAAQLKGSQNLILIDEICGSTDPEEGAALARAFIDSFSENGTFAVITSHLGPLKSGWPQGSRVLNGSMEYDSKTGRPSYNFISGIPGDSLAIQTARRVGVATPIINKALEYLSPASRARLEKLDELERMRTEIQALQTQLRSELAKAQTMKRKHEENLKKFEAEKEQWLAKTVRKAEKKVEEAIQAAKADEIFRRHRSLHEVKSSLPEIVKAKPSTLGLLADNVEDFAHRFPPGTRVFVPSLSQDGIIQSAPNAKGEVMVLSNSVRLQIPWKELRPASVSGNPTGSLVRRSSSFTVALHEEDRTIDLRGKNVEEALEELEIALDRAALNRESRLKVIHGHGTEALKKAVRSYLSRSVYVKKWKAGSPDGGGDGVTWVEIGD
ncbi:MAG: Smr/MutS family protein [Bdellovibrionaceae bacterium]|nr:Smr/MutS family protein [Pseudobdellovibrionaceae bacterium]